MENYCLLFVHLDKGEKKGKGKGRPAPNRKKKKRTTCLYGINKSVEPDKLFFKIGRGKKGRGGQILCREAAGPGGGKGKRRESAFEKKGEQLWIIRGEKKKGISLRKRRPEGDIRDFSRISQ